jgi:hypothetical protein
MLLAGAIIPIVSPGCSAGGLIHGLVGGSGIGVEHFE